MRAIARSRAAPDRNRNLGDSLIEVSVRKDTRSRNRCGGDSPIEISVKKDSMSRKQCEGDSLKVTGDVIEDVIESTVVRWGMIDREL